MYTMSMHAEQVNMKHSWHHGLLQGSSPQNRTPYQSASSMGWYTPIPDCTGLELIEKRKQRRGRTREGRKERLAVVTKAPWRPSDDQTMEEKRERDRRNKGEAVGSLVVAARGLESSPSPGFRWFEIKATPASIRQIFFPNSSEVDNRKEITAIQWPPPPVFPSLSLSLYIHLSTYLFLSIWTPLRSSDLGKPPVFATGLFLSFPTPLFFFLSSSVFIGVSNRALE